MLISILDSLGLSCFSIRVGSSISLKCNLVPLRLSSIVNLHHVRLLDIILLRTIKTCSLGVFFGDFCNGVKVFCKHLSGGSHGRVTLRTAFKGRQFPGGQWDCNWGRR